MGQVCFPARATALDKVTVNRVCSQRPQRLRKGCLMCQEQRLAAAFTELSDVPRQDFDAGRYTHLLARHSVNLLGVDAAGWLLTEYNGQPEAAGGTSDAVRLLQVIQLRTGEG